MNRVVHFEIHADDLDRAQKFYESVFGWKFIVMGPEMGNYRLIETGPGPDEMAKGVKMEDLGINGGMLKRNAEKPKDGMSPMAFVCTIGVDDLDASIAKARAAGGSEHMAKMAVGGVGWLAYYADTEGNIFGMMQADKGAK